MLNLPSEWIFDPRKNIKKIVSNWYNFLVRALPEVKNLFWKLFLSKHMYSFYYKFYFWSVMITMITKILNLGIPPKIGPQCGGGVGFVQQLINSQLGILKRGRYYLRMDSMKYSLALEWLQPPLGNKSSEYCQKVLSESTVGKYCQKVMKESTDRAYCQKVVS